MESHPGGTMCDVGAFERQASNSHPNIDCDAPRGRAPLRFDPRIPRALFRGEDSAQRLRGLPPTLPPECIKHLEQSAHLSELAIHLRDL